jgi:glucose-6-phosphate-specific signal transduction histidine kinase
MTNWSGKLLHWSPRILGILVCLFLALFSLDAFEGEKTFAQTIVDFAIHLTPVLILLAVLVVAWRWEWVGALVFTGVAVVYAYVARTHVSWIPIIAGPLLLVGILFFWSWISRRDFHATT